MEVSRMKRILVAVVSCLMVAGMVYAAHPAKNVSATKHPNLAAALVLCADAYQKLGAAQVANEFDMNGHAAKAKTLIEEAGKEIKLAAEAANHNK
jgi:hypothetical protein